ncbi:UPF0496 protein At3g19330-like [Mangifera indica]|uniref:UPF0496 protein At3g19330-like n=1 Tax=Mangifera indica TaxID=29780 RepID=UPI001CFBF88F|nr:UPF0496 protein At3g19330-like [Mangifera indica]XP_044501330.1 UPF0496 protein At3g19330-like [Mangifera indica]XP_044504138.1 UPF0496 protein At3g19330-like [Mangifera indica]XP_044504139.1 UPF0496 protein At3g19330-like [Mangifera indica]
MKCGLKFTCLSQEMIIYPARVLHRPLLELLDIFPLDHQSISQSLCDNAFEAFLHFDCVDNPFPCPDANNFQEMRHCFSKLKQQLDHNLRKSHSRVSRFHHTTRGTANCIIGTAVAFTITTAATATQALLDTIDWLVGRLYTAIEGGKLLVRFGLERGNDKHSIQEAVKKLKGKPAHSPA